MTTGSPHTEILRLLMSERGLSARALGVRAGLGSDAIRNIWRGRANSPRSKTMAAIAAALGVRVAVLYGEEPPPPPPPRPGTTRRPMLASAGQHDDEPAARPPPGTGLVPVADLDREGGPDLRDPLREAGALTLPAGWLASLAPEPAALVAVFLRAGAPPAVPPGAWALVDTAARPARGTFLLWDGFEHAAGRLFRGPGGALAAEIGGAEGVALAGYVVCGRVVARLAPV